MNETSLTFLFLSCTDQRAVVQVFDRIDLSRDDASAVSAISRYVNPRIVNGRPGNVK
jgi:hypothetical protein